jgi:hypothetical protein
MFSILGEEKNKLGNEKRRFFKMPKKKHLIIDAFNKIIILPLSYLFI